VDARTISGYLIGYPEKSKAICFIILIIVW